VFDEGVKRGRVLDVNTFYACYIICKI